MDDEQQGFELQDDLQGDVTAEDLLDDVLGGGDVIDDFHSLKGMISGALGRSGFKFSFVVVLLFNFAYTVYNAFTKSTKTEISIISLNNCSCDPSDRMFYGFTTFGFMALWILFLLIFALYNVKKFMCESWCNTSQNNNNGNEETEGHKSAVHKGKEYRVQRDSVQSTEYRAQSIRHRDRVQSTMTAGSPYPSPEHRDPVPVVVPDEHFWFLKREL